MKYPLEVPECSQLWLFCSICFVGLPSFYHELDHMDALLGEIND